MPNNAPPAGQPLALLLGLLLVTVSLAGCTTPAPPPGNNTTPPPDPNDSKHTIWPAHVPGANETRLMQLIRDQVYIDNDPNQIRYRTPGTTGHEDTVPLLDQMLQDAGLTTTRETWTQELSNLGEVNLTNMYGVRDGTDPEKGEIWIAAHWDSRAWADADGPACEGPPVPGANDGAAAVASVTHAAAQLPTLNHTLRVALFDAEDQGNCGDGPPYFGWVQGSAHAVETRQDASDRSAIKALVLVDMPGSFDLEIEREGYSHSEAPRLTDVAFAMAERLNASAFENTTGPSILDDHRPFLDVGVPAVDFIHLDNDDCRRMFPCTHHRVNDTVENVSPASVKQVTRVLMGTVLAIDRGALDRAG